MKVEVGSRPTRRETVTVPPCTPKIPRTSYNWREIFIADSGALGTRFSQSILFFPCHCFPTKSSVWIITRFVISVAFYEITNVQRVYWSDTAVFVVAIQSIFYIRYNYMFRRLIMAIFRLYMKYLLSLIRLDIAW